MDLHDGRPVWKAPIAKLESDMYVAGVFDEKVLIVGKGYVRFHSLATGQQLREPLLTGVPTGVGAATDDLYFLPIKAAKDKSLEPGIVAIDYKAMQTKGTSRSRKKETAGNLLFHDATCSPSPGRRVQLPATRQQDQGDRGRLGKNPNDPIGLIDLAMLQHDDGRLVPAIGHYQKALAANPPEELRAKGREKLFEAITELLQNDFNAGERLLPEYSKLCTVEVPETATDAQKKLLAEEELRRKSNFHALVAKGRETQGKLLEAFEAYMAYGTLVGNKEMVTVPDDPGTVARPDVWARARIQSMIKKATPEQRKPLENKVVEEWNKVKAAADLEQLRGFVKVFGGMFEAGAEARITLADKLAVSSNEDDVREAEYMLLSVRGGDEPWPPGRPSKPWPGCTSARACWTTRSACTPNSAGGSPRTRSGTARRGAGSSTRRSPTSGSCRTWSRRSWPGRTRRCGRGNSSPAGTTPGRTCWPSPSAATPCRSSAGTSCPSPRTTAGRSASPTG